ncbi:hypothetical protein HPP92_019669 [Vanilla planifolia]|uniref:Serine-threonine/tyrosine-protein kinase catalytic domain-containing protein n=1 Tax=Vanilla planifolia TaxID=51239 RepID=A0A835ULY7_VANPL|nr:hypothetical protein HPP92_019669 [Vanilla planifolia]
MGFGCSIVEMLSGHQPWQGKSPTEVYNLVVRILKETEHSRGLPPELENILYGCFEYDFRNRPLMTHVMDVLTSCRDAYIDESWSPSGRALAEKSCYKEWSLLKDVLQVGDTVRSRRSKTSCKKVCMAIPEGTVVGMESKEERDDFVLLRVHRFHQPLKVHSSMVERVTHGFAAGDWVRLKEEGGKHSPMGILHAIHRDGTVAVAFVGMETLWEGDHSELQMAQSYFVGQFLRIKSNVSCPRFDWPRKKRGDWETGKVCQILPNGCLVVTFPGRLSFGEAPSFLADPSEVEAVCFASYDGFAKKVLAFGGPSLGGKAFGGHFGLLCRT